MVGFKNYLKTVLYDLKIIYELKNNSAEFHVWNDLLGLLPADNDLLPLHHGPRDVQM